MRGYKEKEGGRGRGGGEGEGRGRERGGIKIDWAERNKGVEEGQKDAEDRGCWGVVPRRLLGRGICVGIHLRRLRWVR